MRIERSRDSTCKLCHFMNIFIDHNASINTLDMYKSKYNSKLAVRLIQYKNISQDFLF